MVAGIFTQIFLKSVKRKYFSNRTNDKLIVNMKFSELKQKSKRNSESIREFSFFENSLWHENKILKKKASPKNS